MSLAACNRGKPDNAAVRQAVIDHLAGVGLNVQGMDVNVTNFEQSGNQADATVSIAPKGVSGAQGMSMKYHLQQQGNKWVVTGRSSSGGHGATMPGAGAPGGAMPGTPNPHGGAPGAAAPGGGAQMPAPENLPPANTKK